MEYVQSLIYKTRALESQTTSKETSHSGLLLLCFDDSLRAL
jgi:hypothetical protein